MYSFYGIIIDIIARKIFVKSLISMMIYRTKKRNDEKKCRKIF